VTHKKPTVQKSVSITTFFYLIKTNKMSDRATCWSVTINNPISADDENISLAKQRSGWKVDGQLEQGENGTKHYQLMVKTPQVRFATIKKAFPRAHIEPARNAKALAEYVHKDDTRIGSIPSNDKYPSLTALWTLFDEYLRTEQHAVPTGEEALVVFDQFISLYIELGYHIETMGVNPQIRSSVKKYLPSIIFRTQIIRRQETDRQTAINNTSESIIHDEGQVQETVCTNSESEEESSREESDQDTESGSESSGSRTD